MDLSQYRGRLPESEQVQRLREELWRARHMIVDLMPEAMRDLLTSYHRCATREETHSWANSVVMQVVAHAVPIPQCVGSIVGDRAVCPLCGREGSDPYLRGFALPEGLRRHLVGFGNAQQCGVMEAAMRLAEEYWDFRFAEQEAKEEAEARLCKAKRRLSETQCLTSPNGKPQLIDEGTDSWSKHRSSESLQWAEERLRGLGFSVNSERNVKSYTTDHDTYVVYADPRTEGRIDFKVSKKTPSGRVSRSNIGHRYQSFHLRDEWRHDLATKYQVRLQRALTKLE